MNWSAALILLGVACGMMIAAQGAINGRLSSVIGGPIQAALISFTVGWLALLVLNLLLGNTFPLGMAVNRLPWWAWMGGLLGAVMVASSATAVPRVGVAAWVAAVIAGQLFAAVLYDHIGAFGQVVKPATPLRLLGVAFLGIGVFLVRRF